MSASIVLSNLSFATPDGRRLFNDLNLSFGAERAGLVGRNGVGKTTLLKLVAGDLRPGAGSIAASGSIGVLRQALQPDADETIADLFGVRQALALLRRAERGQASIEELAGADWDVEARIGLALGRLGLEADAETRLAALSGGQRTRAALGALIFAEPDFILLDEPTNNLDRDGREAVVDLLASWRGGAVVVSHDRELLDTMDSIIELTTLGATRYGGNWSRYHALKALELEAAQANLAGAEARLADVDRRAQTTAERKARKDSAGRRKGARGDIPRIALGKRRDAAEATSGENARLAERRRADALDAVSVARERVEVLQPFSVDLPPTGLPAGRTVLEMDRVEAGYASGQPVIRNFSLTITGPERIALTGPNGSGKTTLLALVAGGLKPWAGNLRVAVPFALLDQSVSILDPTASIRANFLRLNPGANENACRAALARFMFRADAALQVVSTLSGGQMLRAGLACVLGGPEPVPFLILDEPTNHLDTDSIEAVEAGLRAYDGALLVVSHDEPFLEAIGLTRRLKLGGAPI